MLSNKSEESQRLKIRTYQKFIMKNRKSRTIIRMKQISIKMISWKNLQQKEDLY